MWKRNHAHTASILNIAEAGKGTACELLSVARHDPSREGQVRRNDNNHPFLGRMIREKTLISYPKLNDFSVAGVILALK